MLLLLLSGCDDSHIEGYEPGQCSDRADNDRDGFYDCDDSDCTNAPACQGADDDSGSPDDDDTTASPDDDDTTPNLKCRPIDEPWIPGTPLRLPCEPTTEPCDTIDNDNDGITDPHCPTMPCTTDGTNWSTAACQFDGLLLDADCNIYGEPEPGCNQIDGAPFDQPTSLCQGMLCPPGLKCFAGTCIEGGNRLPEEACSSGEQCPLHAGCIPDVYGDPTSAICVYFCAYAPCPPGYSCVDHDPIPSPSGIFVSLKTCHSDSEDHDD